MSQHSQTQDASGTFLSQILSARSRRKGTDHSVELALYECAQETESDGKGRQYQKLIANIREGLLEATDPIWYSEKKRQILEEAVIVQEEYLQQFMTFDSPNPRVQDELEEQLREDDYSPDLSATYKHFGSFEFEFKGILPVIEEDNAADAETDVREETSPSKFIRGNPQLSIQVKGIENDAIQEDDSQKQSAIRLSRGSCDKGTLQKGFFGIDSALHLTPHSNSIKDISDENNKREIQKIESHYCHRKSSEDQTQIVIPIFNLSQRGRKSTSMIPQMTSQQKLLYLPRIMNHVVASPTAAGNRSQQENYSPKSSNVSSFYMDHIEDMIPEKILLTHKKLNRNYHIINPDAEPPTLLSNTGIYGGPGGISPMIAPHTPIGYGFGPFQKHLGSSISSLNRKLYFRWRKGDDKMRHQEPPFHVKISQLKDSLTKYKDTKAQKKEIAKKNMAQSLKFLRKLGAKLRKQNSCVRKQMAGKYDEKQAQSNLNNSVIAFKDSPRKSNTEESPQKISPRQSIMQSQYLKYGGIIPEVTQGFQIKVHDVQPANETRSGQRRMTLCEVQGADLRGFLNPISIDPFTNLFNSQHPNGMNMPLSAKNDHEELPSFKPGYQMFSFERQGSFNFKDRSDSNDLVAKSDPTALKRGISSDFGPNIRSNNQSCDFAANTRQGSFADVRSKESNSTHNEEGKHPGGNLRIQSNLNNIPFDDPSRQFSFANKNLMSAFHQLQQLQSPIPGMRTDVKEDLDDAEEVLMEAIQEYRDSDFIKDFSNYKNYYNDAIEQNAMQKLQIRQELCLGSSAGSNKSAIDFDNVQPRSRDQFVSFKDQRHFENSSSEIWKQHMDNLLLDDSSHRDNEKTNPTPRVPTMIEDIIEEEEFEGNDIDRQVSQQDDLPFIDQSQALPHQERRSSLPKSEKKSQFSDSSYKKICHNIRDLASMLDKNSIQKGKSESRKTIQIPGQQITIHDGPQGSSSRNSRQDDYMQHASKVSSMERGQNRITPSGSRSPSGGSLNKLIGDSPKNATRIREKQMRSEIYQMTLFNDKQALKHIHKNLRRLYGDLNREDGKSIIIKLESPGLESLMNLARISSFGGHSNLRAMSYGTIQAKMSSLQTFESPQTLGFQESPVGGQMQQMNPQQKTKGHRPQQPKQRQVPQINLNLLQCVRSDSLNSKLNVNGLQQ